MATAHKRIDDVYDRLDNTNNRIKLLKDYIDPRFDRAAEFFEKHDARLVDIEDTLDEHSKKHDEHSKRFDKIDITLAEHSKKHDEHSKRFDKIDITLDEHSKKLDQHELKLDRLAAMLKNSHASRGHQRIEYVPHLGLDALAKPKGYPRTVKEFWELRKQRESAFGKSATDVLTIVKAQLLKTLCYLYQPTDDSSSLSDLPAYLHDELAMVLGLQYDNIQSFFLAWQIRGGSNSPQPIEKRKRAEEGDSAADKESSASRSRKTRKGGSPKLAAEIAAFMEWRRASRSPRSGNEHPQIEDDDSNGSQMDSPAQQQASPQATSSASILNAADPPDSKTSTELRRERRRVRNAEIRGQFPPSAVPIEDLLSLSQTTPEPSKASPGLEHVRWADGSPLNLTSNRQGGRPPPADPQSRVLKPDKQQQQQQQQQRTVAFKIASPQPLPPTGGGPATQVSKEKGAATSWSKSSPDSKRQA